MNVYRVLRQTEGFRHSSGATRRISIPRRVAIPPGRVLKALSFGLVVKLVNTDIADVSAKRSGKAARRHRVKAPVSSLRCFRSEVAMQVRVLPSPFSQAKAIAEVTEYYGNLGEQTARTLSRQGIRRRLEDATWLDLQLAQLIQKWVRPQRYATWSNLWGGTRYQSPGETTGERVSSLSTIRYTGMGEWVAGQSRGASATRRGSVRSMTRPSRGLL